MRDPETAAPPSPEIGGEEKGEEEEIPFGQYLRRERERRRISAEEMAAMAHMPLRYLEALEDDAYDDLPPQPYVRGFLSACARHLGLDNDRLRERFEATRRLRHSRRGEESRGAVFALFSPRSTKLQWRDWALPILLAVAVVTFLAGRSLWWGIEIDRREGAGPEAPLPETSVPAGGGTTPEPFAVMEVQPPPPAEGGVSVLVRADETVWIAAASDGEGTREWTLKMGERKEIRARTRVELSIGDAGAVRLNVNGRELGFIGQKGEVKRKILFTPEESP